MAGPITEDLASPAQLTMVTLGTIGLCACDGRELLSAGKPLALLVYLAAVPNRSATREHLLDLLWSDLSPDKARHALRQTVWYLRQILGPDCLTNVRGTELTLTRELISDRDRLLAALDRNELEAAVAIYAGPFLPGFAVPGGLEFEHWTDVERQRLRAAYLRAADTLTRRWLDQGRSRDAVVLARRARDAARAHEGGWRLLLEALRNAGNQLGFAMEAAALMEMLASDGRAPEPATLALVRREQSGSREPPNDETPALRPAFVGREREFAAAILAWERVRAGRGQHVHVTGGPGLGKTRFLYAVEQRLRFLGARVVTVRASPGDRTLPYGFAGEVVRLVAALPGAAAVSPSAAGTLVMLAPSLSARFASPPDSSHGTEALRRRSNALRELLTAVREERPCALLLDDLHWADPVSLQVLQPLFEHVENIPSLIVTASRAVAQVSVVAEPTLRLDLAPLTTPQLADLVASVGRLPEERWAAALPNELKRATAGSPLLVLETLQLALDRGLLTLDDGAWHCGDFAMLRQDLEQGGALRQRIERLEQNPRWLLELLATAETPLTVSELADAANRDPALVEAALLILEQRGLASRLGESWAPAHDEIAAEALAVTGPQDLLRAHAGLGLMLTRSREASRAALERGARHLAAAGDRTELRRLFLRYIGLARKEGDHRRLRLLARQALLDRPPEEAAELLRSLGRLNRLRYGVAPRAVMGAGVAAMIVAAAITAMSWLHRPEAMLFLWDTQRDLQHDTYTVPIRWNADDPETPFVAAGPGALPIQASGVKLIVPGHDRKQWYYSRNMGDGRTSDISRKDAVSDTSLVFSAPRDDEEPALSPDGHRLVFVTTKFGNPGTADNYDLALLDLDHRKVTQLTSGPGMDESPFFSPDGLRIVFDRVDGTSEQYCWIVAETGTSPTCTSPGSYQSVRPIGWMDTEKILAVVGGGEKLSLASISLGTGAIIILQSDLIRTVLSPDRRWIATLAEWRGPVGPDWWVAPLANPGAPHRVDLGARAASEFKAFWRFEGGPEPLAIDRIRIANAPPTLGLDASHDLTLQGVTSTGGASAIPFPARWSSSDTSVATVDSTGIVRPRSAGRVTIRASVGPLRDSAIFEIHPIPVTMALEEDWSHGIEANWVAFGTPRPSIRKGPGGILAFQNGGDGSYASGAYSRKAWSATNGLGVEAKVSARVTRTQWQQATIALIAGLDSSGLAAWDHASGAAPFHDGGRGDSECDVAYPSVEGTGGVGALGMTGGFRSTRKPVDPKLGDGHWFHLRLQLFPDGTCGVALDGVPLWRSRSSIRRDLPISVVLGSASADTDILHGPVEIWEGVKTDVQWSELP